jgi:hypothetical protein
MVRKVIIAVLTVVVIGGGAWYYFSRLHSAPIEKVLSNPEAYAGKEVTIEGEVTDRTAFFGVVKFFKLKDKTGEIIVVTKGTFPPVKSKVRVKGRIDEAFPIGDQKLLVFTGESINEEGGNK